LLGISALPQADLENVSVLEIDCVQSLQNVRFPMVSECIIPAEECRVIRVKAFDLALSAWMSVPKLADSLLGHFFHH
jgi:hypothetical protein